MSLRERWLTHVKSRLLRPVLFIDEAQEMPACILNELRLLTSMQFDSQFLLSFILAGDKRLNDKLRRDEFSLREPHTGAIKYGVKPWPTHGRASAFISFCGQSRLTTQELMQTLCDHAMGNYRALCIMAGKLLSTAAQQEKTQLDEKAIP